MSNTRKSSGIGLTGLTRSKVNYPHLTRILSAEFPKLKLDENTRDLNKIGGIIIDGKLVSIEEFLTMKNPSVDGDLDLSHNKEITFLPEGLKVGGSLSLRNTKITSLPEGLEVAGSLWLNNTPITSLPEDLKVGKDLWLRNTNITSLPNDLKVDGDLNLDRSKITSLPEGLKVGGSLSLIGTNITSLPEGLEVSGSLFLWASKITSLPKGLKVKGSVYVDNPFKIKCSEELKKKLKRSTNKT